MPIKVNALRRRLMRGLTRKIGNSQDQSLPTFPADHKFKRILVCRPNHRLGNLLLITPLLQEISTLFPQCQIDVFLKGNLGPILFRNYQQVDRLVNLPKKPFNDLPGYFAAWTRLTRNKYDLIINVDANSSSGRLSTLFADSELKLFSNRRADLEAQYPDYRHMAKFPVYNFRGFLSEIGIEPLNAPVSPLNLKLNSSEISAGKKVLDDLVKNEKPTLLIFTYATGRKCYSREWWSIFYGELKAQFPDYNIVEVLPVENVSQIDFQAPSFYSKDVREIGSFIANASVFIGADGGIMHLASSVGTPTIGLFSVTKKDVYEPYNPKSLGIDTRETSSKDIVTKIQSLLKG